MPLEESDSHVKVNWVLVGVVFSCSSKLTLLGPWVGEGRVAAFAMAVEIMPWSDASPKKNVSNLAYLILYSGTD